MLRVYHLTSKIGFDGLFFSRLFVGDRCASSSSASASEVPPVVSEIIVSTGGGADPIDSKTKPSREPGCVPPIVVGGAKKRNEVLAATPDAVRRGETGADVVDVVAAIAAVRAAAMRPPSFAPARQTAAAALLAATLAAAAAAKPVLTSPAPRGVRGDM